MQDRSRPVPPSPKVLSDNTRRAYSADWAGFTRWCRLNGSTPLPPSPEVISLYLSHLAGSQGDGRPLSLASIERRLSGLVWNYAQRGFVLDRQAPPIATALTTIRERMTRPPARKDTIGTEEVRTMAATLPHDLRGLRDRAILLIGHSAALRRSEIVSLDLDGPGKITPAGAQLRLGDRPLEIPRATSERSCPVAALESWLRFAGITSGPVFVRISRDGKRALAARLSDKHVARLVKRTALDAGLRPDLPERERTRLYAGESLRGGPSPQD